MFRLLVLAGTLAALAVAPAFAQSGPPLYPGDPYTFHGAIADAEAGSKCGTVGVFCEVKYGDLSVASPRMHVGTGLVAGVFGTTAAVTGRLANPFYLAPGPKHPITAKLIGTVSWRGWLQADIGAYDNTSSSEIGVAIYDNTDPSHRKLVASQTLHTSSVSGAISDLPVPNFERDIGSAGFDLVVDLEPGHYYFAAVEAMSTSNSGALGLLAANHYATDGSSFPALNDGYIEQTTMRIKLDPDYQDQLDKLSEQIAHHTHGYLTGRGAGHNNSAAVTTGPIDAAPTTAADIPAGESGALAVVTAAPDRIELAARLPKDAESPRIERRTAEGEWTPVSEVGPSGVVVDRAVVPGARYGYRLGTGVDGTDSQSDELWIDVPIAVAFGLETARPNPIVGKLSVTFALPSSAPATLALYDVQGRLVMSREVGSMGLGRHTIEWAQASSLASGVYLMRLGQEGNAVTTKVALVR